MSLNILAALFALAVSVSTATAQNCNSYPNILTNGQSADANQVMANFSYVRDCLNGMAAPRGYMSGLILSTTGNSTAFTVSTGIAASGDTSVLMKLPSSITKTTSAWIVGNNGGALDAGTIANNTWYHVYLIERLDTGVADVLLSLSATTPALPTAYSVSRRLGSMKTNTSAQWISFFQNGDDFWWSIPVSDVPVSSPPDALGHLVALSIPPGVRVVATVNGLYQDPTGGIMYFSSPDGADLAPSASAYGVQGLGNSYNAMYERRILSNKSQQIRYRGTNATALFNINTAGWLDRRGRDD